MTRRRFLPVKRVYTFHYASSSSTRSFATYPGESLLVGVFVDKQSALSYRTLFPAADPDSAKTQELRSVRPRAG